MSFKIEISIILIKLKVYFENKNKFRYFLHELFFPQKYNLGWVYQPRVRLQFLFQDLSWKYICNKIPDSSINFVLISPVIDLG